jgi:uncharacterized membrane protein YeaQ/YmgE (transglycosylase-associated protein family)
MDLHMVGDGVAFVALLATIWVVVSRKTIPELVKELATGQGPDRLIIGVLVLIAASITWLILHSSSSDTHLSWYDLLVIGLVASVVGLLLSRTNFWSLLGEVILGPVGAFAGNWFVDAFIHPPSFSARISFVFVSALALITLLHLCEYFPKEGTGRLTMGILLLIIATVGSLGVYSSSLNASFAWYHLLLIGLVVSAISLLIPGPQVFNIVGETIIGPVGAFGGNFLVGALVQPHDFYGNVSGKNVGIIFLIAFGLMSFIRLVYYQYHSKRDSADG